MRQIERREWSLSWAAIIVTLLLTAGIASFALEMLHHEDLERSQLVFTVRGLVGAVLLFDLYVIYQQFLLQRPVFMRRSSTPSGAGERPDSDRAVANLDEDLGTRTGDGEPAEIEEEQIRRGIDATQRAIKREWRQGERRLEAL